MYYELFLFLTLTLISFVTDISFFFLYHDQFLYFVLYLYISKLLHARNLNILYFLGAIACLESFIFYSALWVPLIALLALTIAEIKLRHNFYQSWGYTLGVGTLFLCAQILVIEPFFIGLHPSFGYIFFKVCANIGVVGILSLKQYYQDKRDNRGTRF